MNPQQERGQLNPHFEECLRMNHCWLWFVVLGVVITVLGVIAVGATFLATITTVLLFGILLLMGGVVQIVNAFLGRTWKAFFLHALIGVLHVIVGALMIEHPLRAAEGLTIMLAVAFLFGGVARLVYSATHSFSGRGWVVLNGFVTLFLGFSIWQQWPESSLWVIGLFVGIDLIFTGISWVMLGLAVKSTGPASAKA